MNVACGACHSDLHVIRGELNFPLPCILGHEITGEVVEHGPSTDAKVIQKYSLPSLLFILSMFRVGLYLVMSSELSSSYNRALPVCIIVLAFTNILLADFILKTFNIPCSTKSATVYGS